MDRSRMGLFSALFASQGLFLWMYLSTHSVEGLAQAGLLEGGRDIALSELTARYAAEWRHGLVGLWPVYVPGFLAVTITTWLWSIGRSLHRVDLELAVISGLALGAASLLTPIVAQLVLRDMRNELGVVAMGPPGGPTITGVLLAIYSLLAWNAFVVSCHRLLWRRSLLPLLVPVILDLILYVIRPFTADDLVATWFGRAAAGDVLACTWLAAVPVLATLLIVAELRYEHRRVPANSLHRSPPAHHADLLLLRSGERS
jgi:hypothetical protein